MNKVTLGYFAQTTAMTRRVSYVMQSGRLSYGTESREFEKRFADYCDCDYGVISNSGTSALLVALEAMAETYGWSDLDEVIVPSLTFVATVNAVIHCNLQAILVDVDPRTYNIDPFQVEAAITDKTKAIIPVHLFGGPADMESILDIANRYDLRVVEDCCEAFGAQIGENRVGSFGDIGCFSTYVGHHIVTGVGGMCTTNDPNLAAKMRSFVNHGIDVSELPAGERYEPSHLSRKFLFTSIGHSFRVTELEAAIGIEQLNMADNMLARRADNASYLSERLAVYPALQLPQVHASHYNHSYMVYPIVSLGGRRDELMSFLRKNGIECRTMVPLTNQPCYDLNEDDWPNAQFINHNGLYVGCHERLNKKDLDYLADTILKFFDD